MTEVDPETVDEIETVFVPLHELVRLTPEQQELYGRMQRADVERLKDERIESLEGLAHTQADYIAKLEQSIAHRDATIGQLTGMLQGSVETGKALREALRSMQGFAEHIHAERYDLERWKGQHGEVIGLLEALHLQMTIHMDCDSEEAWLRIHNAVLKGIFAKICDEAEMRVCRHCMDCLCGDPEGDGEDYCDIRYGDNNDSYLRGVHVQNIVRTLQIEGAAEPEER